MEHSVDTAKLTDTTRLRVHELREGYQSIIAKIDRLAADGAAHFDAAKERLAQDVKRVKEQLAEYVQGRIQELAEYSECTKDTQQRLETAEHLVHSLYPGAVMSTPETPLGPPNALLNQKS